MSAVGSAMNLEEVRLERRRSWRQRASGLTRSLFSCRCLGAQEKDFSPDLQDERDDNRITGMTEEVGNVHIIVEDLGLVNPTFTLSLEDNEEQDAGGPTPRCALARLASSVSVSQWVTQKKMKLAPLSSLPLQPSVAQGSLNGEEDSLLFDAITASPTSDGSLLTPPVINLIPPTPSDVDAIDDDQFFDINSEEDSVALMSGSEGVDSVCSLATAELDAADDKEGTRKDRDMEGKMEADDVVEDCPSSPPATETNEAQEEISAAATTAMGKKHKEKLMQNFLRSTFQVAPLPDYPRKRSLSIGISLLQFTEHNLVTQREGGLPRCQSLFFFPSAHGYCELPPDVLSLVLLSLSDDLSGKDSSSHDLLKAELRLLPLNSKMETFLHQRKPAARTCSLGETMPRSHTFHAIGQSTENVPEEEGSPRQRRITVASYIPQPKDQNGNFAGKELNGPKAKALAELDTEEVCQWFSGIGLHKCLPLIRGADLCGSHIASIDLSTLELLQVSDLNDRERLLSAIYEELHPPNMTSQKVDSLLATFGSHSVESFTAALMSITKSNSSPHFGNLNQCSFRFRQRSAVSQRNSQLIEITIKVCSKEQIVHLRTPKDTTVGKVLESCLKMLGNEEEKDTFVLKATEDELPMEQQVGSLLGTDSQLIELLLCKKVKPIELEPSAPPVSDNCDVESQIQCCSDNKLQDLNQQVESLQSIILQVQELHLGLVAFCGELRNMDSEQDMGRLSFTELEERLSQAQSSLQDKRQSLQALKDSLSTVASHRTGKVELRLLEKMKLNCRVFQEEITLIHLNRQVASLQVALEESHAKEKAEGKCSTLGQLVSLQSPAMLVATQETLGPDGFGFTAQLIRGQGLVVVGVRVENSFLSVGDRLVEVNGVSVVGSGEEELQTLLQQQPTAHIIVLRRPPPQDPLAVCPEQHHLNSAPWSPGVCAAATRARPSLSCLQRAFPVSAPDILCRRKTEANKSATSVTVRLCKYVDQSQRGLSGSSLVFCVRLEELRDDCVGSGGAAGVRRTPPGSWGYKEVGRTC
ncbi:hypothetical protein ACEWY4_021076 [Coilia grayii]|uniref:SAM domain-containing protein n=1 Tax=Coilia grayii TaxID=363190 RepID=A0ABD1J7Y6_9TELE